MALNPHTTRQHLQSFDFRKLFINELGWNNPPHALKPAEAEAKDGIRYHRAPVAELSGIAVFEITTTAGSIPEANERAAIHAAVTKLAAENILIFTNKARTQSLWYWVKREAGKAFRRPHLYVKGQPGDLFISKLDAMHVDISELDAKGNLAPGEGNRRVKKALDVERVTKKFYDQFTKEHAAFLKSFAACIPSKSDAEWYASVMLNRLMFVYFIQHKGFLDNDRDYLRTRLSLMRQVQGKDKFHSFYRYFLIKLFHEGLGGKQRPPELKKLVGKIPYLNGGMFDVHELEKKYAADIEIPDAAFERIFDYFDKYDWVLDPQHSVLKLGDKEEINPDVLGYIFEKYINSIQPGEQKAKGAYYTKEDITEYISKNTIIPFLFDAARKECSVAFENPNGPTVWDLLAKNPDRYIYAAVKKGADLPLPKNIAAGIKDVSKRDGWNKSADGEFALPTEIWREVVARRSRCEEIRKKLAAGEVRDINDFITLNLDLRQFAQDVIQNCEGPDLLMAFWHAITTITVLDPTCGSGAFIFAALNILEPLYEACLERMAEFLNDETVKHEAAKLKFTAHGYPLLPGGKFEDFAHTLEHVAQHVSPKHFIYKTIILQNLFGVDIMPEAVEICKLRLFLKLAAQVDPDLARDNLGIEPLPDIDFNIRAGNTLVGYATADEVRRVFKEESTGQGKLLLGDSSDAYKRFEDKLLIADAAFRSFRLQQEQLGGAISAQDKEALRSKLKELEVELNLHLAGEYRVKVDADSIRNPESPFNKWVKSHQPFHWFIQFYGILNSGGFDVIIGNPPYVVNTLEKVHYEIREGLFATYPSKNLYAFVFERSLQLGGKHAAIGMIVQLTALSAEKMSSLQDLLLPRGLLVASAFPRRPESIFDGVEMPVTIMLSRSASPTLHTTRVNRFYTEERPSALATMGFAGHAIRLHGHRIAKIGSSINVGIYRKVESQKGVLGSLTSPASKHALYYQEACRYWVKACVGLPFFRRNGERMAPPHGRTLNFRDAGSCAFAGCLVNSTLFYWFYSAFSDCEHINDALIRDFRIPVESNPADWIALESRLAESQKRNVRRKTILTKQGHKIEYDEMDAPKSKMILDEIDTVLAGHYGFTAEELDFILNYDIKYRLGRSTEEEE